ncbi:protein pangolin, isoforms A/H/I/S isoform X2 [Calliphora vicina]|uniref:protein pangolin, isoforms A/H/I/S isoform X2 n=1 Tax=Calliphora vicina TaxID=7373 RepID=UPI00325AD98D
MPHTSHTRHTGSSGDDLGSTDEVKIFKDEGDREDEKISSENLLVEEKSSLIDLTESEEKSGKISSRSDHSPVFSKIEPHASSFNMGYLVSPYTYSNGGAGGLPVTMANKIGLPPFFCHNGDHLTTPPPAHCGIPPYQLDPKAMGLTRPAIYPFPSGQYPYPMLSPDMSQVASWHTPSVYSAASSFRSPYPSSLPINTTLSSDFPFRFSPSLLPSVHTSPHHVLNSHPAIVTSGPKQECNQDTSANHRYSRNLDNKNSSNLQGNDNCKDNSSEKKKPHIKKPLNAFMLYMKEMRAKVVAECTLKESAAINQILGRRWHELSREEQSKYYEKARQERQLHMELYPGWSARDNYGYVSKKKKRKKDRSPADSGGNNMKKCRARFGLDQQNQWCKPCRRKKKCIRYMESVGATCGSSTKDDHFNDLDDVDGQRSDDDDEDDNEHDNLGSCGSGDDNHKDRDDDNESLNQSLSSPGDLSGLSSLQSPSTSLASPLSLLTSPVLPQHGNGLLNTPVSEQLQQHQQHMQVLQAQQQHLNQQLLQQTKLHHHHHQQQQQQQQTGHLQQHQSLGIGGSNSNETTVSAYESGIINAASGVVSTLLPTLSTSTSSGSVSGYGSASSCSTNTTSTSSPASLSDRMVRSLLSGSPAMLLGNRIGHIAMGLAMSNNSISNINSISNDNTYISLGLGAAANANANDCSGLLTSVPTTSTTSSRSSTTTTSLNHIRSENSDKTTALTSTLSPSISSVASPAASSPVATSAATDTLSIGSNNSSHISIPLQRNPIGANPRDINNPLSINQLTKRPRDGTNGITSNSSGSSSINSNTCTSLASHEAPGSGHTTTTSANVVFNHIQGTHHPTQADTLPLPPPHNAMFSNNFTQHFQQQFGHHLVTAAAAAAAKASAPATVTQSLRTSSNSNSNVASSAMSVNLDVGRRPTSETTATNESGAISVT